MKYSELKTACREAKDITMALGASATELPLSNSWKVRAEFVASTIVFALRSPGGHRHGGETSMSRFVPWAMRFME